MNCYVVEKTDALEGHVTVGGCKNTTLKILLSFPHVANGKLSLSNANMNTQTRFSADVLKACGAKGGVVNDEINLEAERLERNEIFNSAIPKMRHFVRMAVPMVTHSESFDMPLPGYSPYGPRQFEPVTRLLKEMGAKTTIKGNYVNINWPEKTRMAGRKKIIAPLTCCRYASEVMVALAVAKKGVTTLINVAQDPDIADLVDFYEGFAPVKIKGKGSSKLIVESEGINVNKEYKSKFVSPGDYLEAATIAAAVIAVGGDVTIDGFNTDRILPLVPTIQGFGAKVEIMEGKIRVTANGKPKAYDFVTGIYPGFPTDAQGPFLTVAALANGSCVVKEKIWSNRLMQVPELNRLGARIDLIDNQTAITSRHSGFYGTTVTGTCPRSTAGLLIAGMSAKGKTFVSGVDLLRNAYGSLESNLLKLGAKFDVKSVKENHGRVSKSYGRLEAF